MIKFRKFSTRRLKPKKVDQSYSFKIPIFKQDNRHFDLICIDFLRYSIYLSVMFVLCLPVYVILMLRKLEIAY